MTNAEILRRVAARSISPEEAAEEMIQDDARARAQLRPRWMPAIAWGLLVALAAMLLAACGVQRD